MIYTSQHDAGGLGELLSGEQAQHGQSPVFLPNTAEKGKEKKSKNGHAGIQESCIYAVLHWDLRGLGLWTK
jgi:hypothetical protein